MIMSEFYSSELCFRNEVANLTTYSFLGFSIGILLFRFQSVAKRFKMMFPHEQ